MSNFWSNFRRRGIRNHAALAACSLLAAGRFLPAQVEPNELEHTKWRLVDTTPAAIRPPAGMTVTLLFEGGKYFLTGCNQKSGSYQAARRKLVVPGPERTTRKACPEEARQVDEALSRLFPGKPTYRLDADHLMLVGGDGAQWVFEKEALPSKQATTKFVYVSANTKACSGVAPMMCLQVRDSKDQPWRLHYGGIQGFEHVPGIEYRLRIKEDRLAHPAADAPSSVWYLDATVEQTVVDRKAADQYEAKKVRGSER